MSGEEEPVAWLRAQITARLRIASVKVIQGCWHVDDEEPWAVGTGVSNEQGRGIAAANGGYAAVHIAMNDPQDTIARCEAELAILDEHYILYRGDTNEAYEEFSVCYPPGIPGLNCGCATCHYKGFGGVEQYGICRTVKFLAGAYRHEPGYREEDWKPGVKPWQAGS